MSKPQELSTSASPERSFSGFARSLYDQHRMGINFLLSMCLFLIVWELVDILFNDPYFFTGPVAVFFEYGVLVQEPRFWENVRYSGLELIYGFALAAGLGVVIGGAVAFSRTLDEMFSPILVGLYATPRAVAAPLFIIWLGLGIESKVGVITLASVFPVIINTQAGIKNVQGEFRMLGRAFNISFFAMLVKIIIPGSLPFLIAGLRLGYSRSVVTIMVAELFGAEAGIGYMIDQATQTFHVAEMMAGIILLTVMGIVGNEILKFIERWASPYKQTLI
jgi:ABC-type nitrate/sulfonate/bicarbonate transport system permease component